VKNSFCINYYLPINNLIITYSIIIIYYIQNIVISLAINIINNNFVQEDVKYKNKYPFQFLKVLGNISVNS